VKRGEKNLNKEEKGRVLLGIENGNEKIATRS
jgi:hypothetical protein